MRVPFTLIAVATALVIASGAKMPTEPDRAPDAAATAGATVVSTEPRAQSAAEGVVWYTDPIAIVLGIVAVFAIVDIAILLAQNAQRGGARVLGPH